MPPAGLLSARASVTLPPRSSGVPASIMRAVWTFTILLAIIGVSIVRLWQRGAVGDWALFLYGLVATTLLASVITTVLNFRRNQL